MIKYKNTSICITTDAGFSTISNEIRYQITSDISDAEILQNIFPDKKFELKNGKLIYSDVIAVPNMWDLIKSFLIETNDVGKSVEQAIIIWSTNMIYSMNLLSINLEDWSL